MPPEDALRMWRRLPQSRLNRVVAVDTHTAGELTRVVLKSEIELPRLEVPEVRRYFAEHHDAVRKRVCREPRGHRDLVVAWLLPPSQEEAHAGVIFMDAQRYPLACGTATVGTVTALVEMGLVEPTDGEVLLETPAGLVASRVEMEHGLVRRVRLDMVRACITRRDQLLRCSEGDFRVDLGFVGGFLLLVEAKQLPFPLSPDKVEPIVSLGMEMVVAANQEWEVLHPATGERYTVDGVVFYDDSQHEALLGSGTVVYGASHLDRSPCGTGTTVKMALLHSHGGIQVGDRFQNRGILGTQFTGLLTEQVQVGGFPGVAVELAASASLVSFHELFVTPGDPLADGFLL